MFKWQTFCLSLCTAAPLNFLCLFNIRELIVITLAHCIKSSLWWHKDTKSKYFWSYTVKQSLWCVRLFVCRLCTEITSIKSQFIPQVSGNISQFWERFAVSRLSISTILVEKGYDIYSVIVKWVNYFLSWPSPRLWGAPSWCESQRSHCSLKKPAKSSIITHRTKTALFWSSLL